MKDLAAAASFDGIDSRSCFAARGTPDKCTYYSSAMPPRFDLFDTLP